MVIVGVKRRMEELLGKHMNDLRSVKYVYAFMVTGHPLLGSWPFISLMCYIFFLLIFWEKKSIKYFFGLLFIFGI